MDDPALYHRTFLPDPSCHPPTSSGSIQSRFPATTLKTPKPSYITPTTHPVHTAPPKPSGGFYDPWKGRRLKAFVVSGKNVHRVMICEKTDQKFADYATQFEREYSAILQTGTKNVLDPVVDGLTVVGHFGTVNARRVVVPADSHLLVDDWKAMRVHDFINTLIQMGVPVFIPSGQVKLSEKLWWKPYSSEVTLNVLTTVDGEVLACLGSDVIGVIAEEFWVLDVLLVGKGVADLGAALGRKIVKAISRKRTEVAIRRFLGPTNEVAEAAIRSHALRTVKQQGYIPESGMTPAHFKAFQEAAKESNVIALVRDTKLACKKWLEKRFPGKPKTLEGVSTHRESGIVTARNESEVKIARNSGAFVVEQDHIARRTIPGRFRNGKPEIEELPLKNVEWPVEKGQVIDPLTRKPYVGDYDLMGVVDPKAPGRNLALVGDNYAKVEDLTSPLVKKFKEVVNAKLDRPRVLHGAQDSYGGYRGSCTVFMPDGRVLHLPNEEAVKQFYRAIGRKTRVEAYPWEPAPPGAKVIDLASRRH